MTRSVSRRTPPPWIAPLLRRNVPLAPYTSLRIGGPAALFAAPRTVQEVADLVRYAKELALPWMTLGNGTNVLFPDAGFPGLVIHLGRQFAHASLASTELAIQAGAGLGATMGWLRRHGLRDFDGFIGIPGSVGGAIAMNAGGRETTISDAVRSVTVLTPTGEIQTLSRAECGFGYRESRFRHQPWVVLEGRFEVGQACPWDASALMAHRRAAQPLRWPSSGCVFANPPGECSAGQLIEMAGLSGIRRGGAIISTRHANFMLNDGQATASDLQHLVDIARERVYKVFGVELALELVIATA